MEKSAEKKIGMFGGKFFPMHKGHLYCIDVAASQCDQVFAIIFINGADEKRITKNNDDILLSSEYRIKQLKRVCSLYDNVVPVVIDIGHLIKEDGTDDWDKETPLVREYIPNMTYVYSSEPGYDDYFKEAYPEAKHIVVDEKRKKYPISSTLIRAMDTLKEKEKWMV